MPVSAETLRLLMDAGIEGDDLLRIVESIDRTPTKARSANAERQARFRARKKEALPVTDNVTSNVTDNVTPHARVEDNLQTKEITGEGRKKTARENLADFVSELSSILDSDKVQALVELRKSKGGKLTGLAARLLIAKIQECGIPAAEAADTMVLRNWISIEAAWLTKRQPAARSGAPPPRNGKMTPTEANRYLTELEHERQAQRDNETARIISADFGRRGDVDSLIRGALPAVFRRCD